MNSYAWLSALMRSNIPQNTMKTFGIRRKKNRSMTLSLVGIAASAAAAYLIRNKRGGVGQLFQNNIIKKNGFQSTFNKPVAAGLTEFAKEFSTGLNNMNPKSATTNMNVTGKTNSPHNPTATSATNPISNELITQIAATAKQEGNEQKVDELANKLINTNL